MDLTTTYMGIKLKNPLVASASPLSEDLDSVRRMEDAGLAAIVKHSLFEEQLKDEAQDLDRFLTEGTESYAESLSFFPQPSEFVLGPDEYLDHLRRIKEAVDIPVIGSLNGYSLGGWIQHARLIQEAGADALELNIYWIPTSSEITGEAVEKRYLEIIRAVKQEVSIPVAVKLNPFFSSTAHMAARCDEAGADGLVLFNRFYQPDIDLERLEVVPHILLSTPQALRLPLRWTAILYGRVKASLAVTSGVHTARDVVKVLMAGADAAMLCSTLLKNGVAYAATILNDLNLWLEEHEYPSVRSLVGSMSYKACPNPEAYERAYYTRALQTYHGWLDEER